MKQPRIMKKALALCIILSTVLFTHAQNEAFLGVSVGPSFPIGDFADTSPDNEDAGYAKTGIHLNLVDFGYTFTRYIGVTASWYVNAHNWEVGENEGFYTYHNILAGPMLFVPAGDFMDVMLRPMAGLSYRLRNEDIEGDSEEYGFAMSVAFTMQFHVADNWAIFLDNEIFTGKMSYARGEQQMTAYNVGLGFAYTYH